MRLGAISFAVLMITVLFSFPALGQEIDCEPSLEMDTWELPGAGAGPLVVNPADGSLWTFLHQSGNLVALDTSDGSVILDVPLTIRPTALAFSPDGSMAFLSGEPLDDQIINTGLVQMIDTSDGSVLAEIELEGACNTVYAADNETLYAACGMQYAYEGIIYRLSWNSVDDDSAALNIETQAACGKIPWAIARYDENLYVTDLELQWTMQPDGSMGPPYGAYVWAYEAESLEYIDRSWVGINPSRLAATGMGVLAACSGSKQGEGTLMEPSLSLIDSPGGNESIFIGTAGASDLAISPDGSWAVVSLADWGPPAPGSATALLQELCPGSFPEARRWIYTGDLGLVSFGDGSIITERTEILNDSFFRSVAVSSDGLRIFALTGETEEILVIPVELIMTQ